MIELKKIYNRLIEKNINNKEKLEDLKNKIATSFAVGLLNEDEQLKLIEKINAFL